MRTETSTIDELSAGSFQFIIGDPTKPDARLVKQVVYCTGKFYHEMHERRAAVSRTDVAIVRVEQLYPLHVKQLREIDAKYPAAAERLWAQEEPRNQGAFMFIADRFCEDLGVNLGYFGRPACARPRPARSPARQAAAADSCRCDRPASRGRAPPMRVTLRVRQTARPSRPRRPSTDRLSSLFSHLPSIELWSISAWRSTS